MKSRFFSLLLLVLTYAGQLFASVGQKPESLPQVLDSIQRLMDSKHIPGLFLSIVTKDSILFSGGLGKAVIAGDIPVSEYTQFQMGSITKSFTALAILKLVREGKLSLHSKLKDIAPEIPFSNPWEKNTPVEIIHLLSHSAGFDDMHPGALFNQSGKEIPMLDQVISYKASLHSRWKPGTREAYSNPGFAILGYIIEKTSGIPYGRYIHENIFIPLGMLHSGLQLCGNDPQTFAQGYIYADKEFQATPCFPINGPAAGALTSCAADMSRFVQFLLKEGRSDTGSVFLPQEIQLMETPAGTLAAEHHLPTGYGLASYTSFYGSGTKWLFHGHSGGIPGFISNYVYNRDLNLGISLSNNAYESNKDIIKLLVDYFSSGRSPKVTESRPLDAGQLTPFLGHYRFCSSRNQFIGWLEKLLGSAKVYTRGDTLYIRPFLNKAQAFVCTGDLQFRQKDEQTPSAQFVTNKGGQSFLYLETSCFQKKSLWKIFIRQLVILGCAGWLVIYLPFFLVWLIKWLFRRLRWNEFRIRTLPLISLLVLISMFMVMGELMDGRYLYLMAWVNWRTLWFFTGGILFVLLALLSFFTYILMFRKITPVFTRYFLMMQALALVILAAYLDLNGMIGFAFWSY